MRKSYCRCNKFVDLGIIEKKKKWQQNTNRKWNHILGSEFHKLSQIFFQFEASVKCAKVIADCNKFVDLGIIEKKKEWQQNTNRKWNHVLGSEFHKLLKSFFRSYSSVKCFFFSSYCRCNKFVTSWNNKEFEEWQQNKRMEQKLVKFWTSKHGFRFSCWLLPFTFVDLLEKSFFKRSKWNHVWGSEFHSV